MRCGGFTLRRVLRRVLRGGGGTVGRRWCYDPAHTLRPSQRADDAVARIQRNPGPGILARTDGKILSASVWSASVQSVSVRSAAVDDAIISFHLTSFSCRVQLAYRYNIALKIIHDDVDRWDPVWMWCGHGGDYDNTSGLLAGQHAAGWTTISIFSTGALSPLKRWKPRRCQ